MKDHIELSQSEALVIYSYLDELRELLEQRDLPVRATYVADKGELIWQRLKEDDET